MIWLSGLLFLLSFTPCQGFITPSINLQTPSSTCHNPCHREQSTSLHGGLFGLDKNESEEPPSPPPNDASVPTRVLEIPVSSIKQGGLRFALGLHLVGLQDKGTWRANQASENVLDMFFKDNSAMFSLILEDDAIVIDRFGRPSLAYVLQESLVLHSVLDEINTLAFEGDIEDENRLLRLEEPGDGIEKARDTLPARKA
mmetsp:Transcript_8622/g.18218  ORF Transcript_8622/g.18218 Transcript_8622/m.18218 type:complete len:199 (+) Transcript_8622:110-706(+)|eukprot:CAMPEP_0196150882 /NCGR_PEP_ID=MMETSP0910-20130528/32593_1 /TAXON_ID=49265 /ORGANISM="Thalassiosira rotula, Strain GSO102" /LENGTH=198 /DNA_ID=CAMNT_0041414115 /DNA_START=116 /DNA_END=712 /DNA_ORIENTATION=+